MAFISNNYDVPFPQFYIQFCKNSYNDIVVN